MFKSFAILILIFSNDFTGSPCFESCSDRYHLGYKTGKQDAEWLIDTIFLEVPCQLGPSDSPPELATTTHNEKKCYLTTIEGKRTFRDFIIKYKANLQAKIDSGIDSAFNQGLFDGFTSRLIQLGFTPY